MTFLTTIWVWFYLSLLNKCYLVHCFSQYEGRSQNLKQVPQNFIKTFCVDNVTLTSQLMTLCRRINIASEKITNYRVSSPRNHHCYQINIIIREKTGILGIINFFLFQRHHSKIFKLLKRCIVTLILTSLYQFDKKLTKHFPTNRVWNMLKINEKDL